MYSINLSINGRLALQPCTDPEGDRGSDPHPLVNDKNIGFLILRNTGSDPLKNHKATKLAYNVGSSMARQQKIIGPPLTKHSGSEHDNVKLA